MMKKSIFFTIIILLSIPALVYAEVGDNLPAEYTSDAIEDASGFLPDDLAQRMEFVGSEIDKRNALELFDKGEISHVTYNSDGTLADVTYDDGLKAKYSYERDTNGDISECDINVSSASYREVLKLMFRLTNDGGRVDTMPEEVNTPSYIPPENKPIVVYHVKSKNMLENISRKVIKFDFKEINKAISIARDLKSKAFKEYEDSTSDYYDVLEKKLSDKKVLFKDNASESDRRAAIDKAVEDAYLDVRRAGGSADQAELVSLEKSLREKILDPAREIYVATIEAAQEYINNMIDRLIASNMAVYLDIENDKRIDTVINLQELKT